MKSVYWIIGIVACVMVVGFAIWSKTSAPKNSPEGNELSRVRLGGTDFSVEIVSSPEKNALGLSGRQSICEKCGMLFIFEGVAYRPFWMKDMKFDLDVIYISGDKIVHIARNVGYENGTKEVVRPNAKADKVLEVNAGTSDKVGLKVGDSVGF